MQAYDDYEDEGLTCHTAPGVTFTTMDELKEHYRSDWHRYNLKRKVAGLPVVGRELFERVMQQAAAGKNGAQKVTGTSHLKRPDELPRSARAKRMEEWVETTERRSRRRRRPRLSARGASPPARTSPTRRTTRR